MIKSFWIVILTLAFGAVCLADWPDSASVNMLICGRTGEQTNPKVVATPDGGCYVSWYDNSTGNYNVHLQRLNAFGVPQWGDCGLLIDGHTQDSWITDYDLQLSSTGSALLIMNDIRAGDDRDIFAYSISPSGEFEWGDNGLTVSQNDDPEYDQRILGLPSGNVILLWQQETETGNVLHLRKVNADGNDLWAPGAVYITSTYGVSIGRLASTGSEDVIVQYLVHRGTNMYSPRHLFAQRFNSSGARMWGDSGVVVSNAGGIGIQMMPEIVGDELGGAYTYWYDSRENNQLHVYVARIMNNGQRPWTANGVKVSLSATQMQSNPSLAFMPQTRSVAVFYELTNTGQTQWGMGGQLLNANGDRIWGNDGVVIEAFSPQQCAQVNVCAQDTGVGVVYKQNVSGSTTNGFVKAVNLDSTSHRRYGQTPRVICTVQSGKGRLEADVNHYGQNIAAWQDMRSDAGGNLYLQNINPDGSIGDWITPPPQPSLEITGPADSTAFIDLPVVIHFATQNFEIADSGGNGLLQVSCNGNSPFWISETDSIVVDSLLWHFGFFNFRLELVHYDHTPLDPPVVDSVVIQLVETAAEEPGALLPQRLELLPPAPNPFNPGTTLTYLLPSAGPVRITISNVLGQQVDVLVDEIQSAGQHRIAFNGSRLSGGIYFCTLEAAGAVSVQKLILLK